MGRALSFYSGMSISCLLYTSFGFVELNDGSCHKSLQVVLDRGNLSNYDEIAHQNVGAALIVKGKLVLTPEAKQPFELKAAEIAVEGVSTPDYPLQKKRHSVEFLRTIQIGRAHV